METVGTYKIGLDTPISMLTPRQLFEMMEQWEGNRPPIHSESTPKNNNAEKWRVNSINELAAILGTSPSTVYRMKADGLLDDCISQCGRWMLIEVDKVLEKFRLSNRRKKRG